jgi:uncharacterized protein (PEP-CTERM system associated)
MTGSRWLPEGFHIGRCAAAAAFALAPVAASAADLTITTAIRLEESFSDNANLAEDENDRNSDLVTVVTPSISATMRGGRVNGGLNFSRSESISRTGASDAGSENELAATGQAELWERVAFIDAQASISREVIDETQPSSQSLATQQINRTETRAYNLSPYFLHHFGTWAETRSQITYSQVDTDSEEVSDTGSLTESFVINSGRRFSRFLWSVTAVNSKTPREETPAIRERTIDGNGTYVLDSRLSLLAGLGWQSTEDATLVNQPKGPTWSAGFAAQPGQKTSVRLTVGERDGGTTVDFESSYRLSARTALTASYNEELQTSQQQISDNLSFLAVGPDGTLIDSRTGAAFVPGDDNFGLQDETFRQRVFTLRLSGTRRRNTFSGVVRWESRETEATGVTETVLSTDLLLNRRISERASGGFGIGYAVTDFGTDNQAEEHEVTFSLNYGYQILQDAQLSLTYNLTLRNVNNQDGDFYENAVTAGLTKRF